MSDTEPQVVAAVANFDVLSDVESQTVVRQLLAAVGALATEAAAEQDAGRFHELVNVIHNLDAAAYGITVAAPAARQLLRNGYEQVADTLVVHELQAEGIVEATPEETGISEQSTQTPMAEEKTVETADHNKEAAPEPHTISFELMGEDGKIYRLEVHLKLNKVALNGNFIKTNQLGKEIVLFMKDQPGRKFARADFEPVDTIIYEIRGTEYYDRSTGKLVSASARNQRFSSTMKTLEENMEGVFASAGRQNGKRYWLGAAGQPVPAPTETKATRPASSYQDPAPPPSLETFKPLRLENATQLQSQILAEISSSRRQLSARDVAQNIYKTDEVGQEEIEAVSFELKVLALRGTLAIGRIRSDEDYGNVYSAAANPPNEDELHHLQIPELDLDIKLSPKAQKILDTFSRARFGMTTAGLARKLSDGHMPNHEYDELCCLVKGCLYSLGILSKSDGSLYRISKRAGRILGVPQYAEAKPTSDYNTELGSAEPQPEPQITVHLNCILDGDDIQPFSEGEKRLVKVVANYFGVKTLETNLVTDLFGDSSPDSISSFRQVSTGLFQKLIDGGYLSRNVKGGVIHYTLLKPIEAEF